MSIAEETKQGALVLVGIIAAIVGLTIGMTSCQKTRGEACKVAIEAKDAAAVANVCRGF
jgi:hypothetical protein